MADEVVLYYFDGRGRSETIRMMLCAAKIKFREVLMTERAQMVKLMEDGELLFNSLPLLKIDGLNLIQSTAVVYYLGRKAGMDGKDAIEKAWVDMYFQGTQDLYKPFIGMLIAGTVEECKQQAEPGLKKFLPVFNKALGENSSGFLVGSGMTLADIGLLEALLAIEEFYGSEKLEPYPHLQTHLGKMRSSDAIQHYIKDVRKGPNTEAYVSTVMKVLGRS